MVRFFAKDEIFYHGTYNEFDRFRPLSHFGTFQAANTILSYGPQALKLNKQDLTYYLNGKMPKEKIIPVKLNLSNTYELQDITGEHNLEFYKKLLLYHFVHDMQSKKISKMYDYICKYPLGVISNNMVKKELLKDNLFRPLDGDDFAVKWGNRKKLFYQRLIQYFELLGFDGFHYVNNFEDIGNMSYIVFRPENVIRQDCEVSERPYSIRGKIIPNHFCSRDLKYVEKKMYMQEEENWKKCFKNKLILMFEREQHFLRPNIFKILKAEKVYYANLLIKEILPKIKEVTNQPEYGYHGLSHSQQVGLFSIELALSVRQDPMPVLLAAALHDCARTDDEYCERHGPMCEPIARRFLKENYPNILPIDVERIVNAIKLHTVGMNAKDFISACLWDADRIRLSWALGYDSKFFSTPYGMKLGALSLSEQNKYIQRQEKFLIENNIKTKDQIEYDKEMSNIKDRIGTKFNEKIR